MQTVRLFGPVLAVLVCVSGCMKPGANPEGNEDKPKPRKELVIPVEAITPEVGAISSYIDTHTRVEAERMVEVNSEGVGECIAIFAEEGDRVNAGDVLAELDKREAKASLSQAEVQSRQQKSDFDRAKELYSQGLVAQSEYETARFTYEQGLENLRMQRVRLDQLTIESPIDGVVTQRNVQPGKLVSSGTPVYTVVDPKSFQLTIQVAEKELHRLDVGQPARVTIDAFPDRVFEASVRRINPAIDPTNGTVKVVLSFKDEDQGDLRQSAFARVLLVMDTREDALLLPKDAILEENARKYVYTVVEDDSPPEAEEATPESETPDATKVTETPEGGEGLFAKKEVEAASEDGEDEAGDEPEGPRLIATRVEVQTGLEDSDRIEITDGLTAQSLVVINGQHTLKEGAKVNVTNATEALYAKAGLTAAEALEAAKAKGDQGESQNDGRGRRMRR